MHFVQTFSVKNSNRFDRIVCHHCVRIGSENVRRNVEDVWQISDYK